MAIVLELLKIILGRRSPERIPFSRNRMFACIGLAFIAAALAHQSFWQLSIPQNLLRIVIELGVLVIGLNRLPVFKGRSQKRRQMTMVLFAISALGDGLLTFIAWVSLDTLKWGLAAAIYLAQIYGAANCVQFALQRKWSTAAFYVVGYLLITLAFTSFLSPLLSAALAGAG